MERGALSTYLGVEVNCGTVEEVIGGQADLLSAPRL